MKEAARQLGLNVGNVSAVVRGKCKQTGGFEFKKAPSPDLPGEVWKPMMVNGKNIQVSSLGRFIDSAGIKKNRSLIEKDIVVSA